MSDEKGDNMAKGRALGGMERLFHQQNGVGSSNLCSILFYEGIFDATLLPNALLAVQAAYPLLSAKIVADPKLRYEEAKGELPFQIVERTSDSQWREVARAEVRRQYSSSRIFVTLIQGANKGEIIVAADHVLSDAKSLYAVCQVLIEGFHGRETALVPVGEAWENRVPKPFRGWQGLKKKIHFIRKLFAISPERSLVFGEDTRNQVTVSEGFHLDKATLGRLKATADIHEANINSIFCAAAMLSAFEVFTEQEPAIVSLNTPVSVRDQIVPAASPLELGMFVSAFLQWHALNADTDIFELAKKVKETIRTGVEAGEAILLGLLAQGPKRPAPPKPDKNRRRFEQSITVSNPGRLSMLKDLPEAKIIGYRNLGSLWTQESIVVVVLGYADQLFVDVEVSEERLAQFQDPARLLANRIREKILEIANPLSRPIASDSNHQTHGFDAQTKLPGHRPLIPENRHTLDPVPQ